MKIILYLLMFVLVNLSYSDEKTESAKKLAQEIAFAAKNYKTIEICCDYLEAKNAKIRLTKDEESAISDILKEIVLINVKRDPNRIIDSTYALYLKITTGKKEEEVWVDITRFGNVSDIPGIAIPDKFKEKFKSIMDPYINRLIPESYKKDKCP